MSLTLAKGIGQATMGYDSGGVKVIELVDVMRKICLQLASGGKQIRFVPTMGCLHAGHASLIKRAKLIEDGDKTTVITIVSIFVNPMQFNSVEDFDKYPQTFAQDLQLCQSLGVDYVFAPKCSDIYPQGSSQKQSKLATCFIEPPERLANELEGKSRPGHFRGMLTIVCKLFNIIRPQVAYFGEKDFQQLVLVKNMVESLNMGLEVSPVQTVRDSNGLPLSSRNWRLSNEQKMAASIMFDILDDAREALETRCGQCDSENHTIEAYGDKPNFDTTILASILAASCIKSSLLKCNIDCTNSSGSSIQFDYLKLRCAKDLTDIEYNHEIGAFDCLNGCVRGRTDKNIIILKARLLISIVIANVRLLDNVEVRLNLLEATQL